MACWDFPDSWLRDLTRQRRREALARAPDPVRFSIQGSEHVGCIGELHYNKTRRRGAMRAWRVRQWREGNRRCTYCNIKMTLPGPGPDADTCVTVDHKHPLALGGDDAAWNWAMCCSGCNGAKGFMTEQAYRALFVTSCPSPPQPRRSGSQRRPWQQLPDADDTSRPEHPRSEDGSSRSGSRRR